MVKQYRIRRVSEITGMPRSSVYAAIKAGKFPPPIRIGAKAVAWLETDLEAWQASCQRRTSAEGAAA